MCGRLAYIHALVLFTCRLWPDVWCDDSSRAIGGARVVSRTQQEMQMLVLDGASVTGSAVSSSSSIFPVASFSL
jgi:hypothetical protein